MKKLLLISFLSASTIACAKKESAQNNVNMANPASVYCESLGGKSEIVKDNKGCYGLCHLPDGTTVDEWKLYRDKH